MSIDLVSDDFWERTAPLLPERPPRRHRHPGRLPVPDRVAVAGIVYVLRKAVAWCDVRVQVVGCSG
ncbi:transposase [Streptomyces bungoensis]|uniref:transposase n=1 Tax=Streptomyces bungoensis TaxID=285568 RepID=UPI00131C50FA